MSQLIPLDQMPDQLGEDSNIAWTFDAGPYINTDRFGFDMKAARRMMRVGGIGAAVITAYQGEQSSIQVNATGITGVNADGSATGTASASVAKADAHQVDVSGIDKGYPYATQWSLAKVAINRTELASQISDDVRRGRTRDDAWARQVDRAVRKGLVQAAAKGLVREPMRDWMVRFNTGMYTALVTSDVVVGTPVQSIVTYAAIMQAMTYVIAGVANKLQYGDIGWRDIRLSAFPYGFQPDRLAIAAIMGNTQRLIRPLPNAARG